jgi:glycosyltransferase involved in cell wall biosynthesis
MSAFDAQASYALSRTAWLGPMKISVITVSFNSASTIVDTLRSVNEQSHRDIEHIVIDGASNDDTVALVRRHGRRVAHLVTERDRGIYDAMNKGLALARGDYVGFLNADDYFADCGVLSKIAHAMQLKTIDACYGDLVFVDPADSKRIVRYWRSRRYEQGLCSRGWMPAHPTFYARRSVYERYGSFDLSFRIAADFEMSLRLLDVAGLRTVYIPETLVHMRAGGESTRSLANVFLANREASQACRKHGFRGGVGFMARKLASKLPQLARKPHSPVSSTLTD